MNIKAVSSLVYRQSYFDKHKSLDSDYAGCNWYGFGAMFFGCLSMVIHGSISLVRCLPVINPDLGRQPSIRSTVILLLTNVIYAGIFALGEKNLFLNG